MGENINDMINRENKYRIERKREVRQGGEGRKSHRC